MKKINKSAMLPEKRKPVIIAVISLAALIVLALLVFLAPQFVGKAYTGLPNTAGVEDPGVINENTPFSVVVKANIGVKETVALSFELDYGDLVLDGLCDGSAVVSQLPAGWGFKRIDCDVPQKISFEHATFNFENSINGNFEVARIYFAGAPTNTYDLTFDSFDIINLDDQTDIIGNGMSAGIVVEPVSVCTDTDGDSYGVGPDCAGPDCDDADDTKWQLAYQDSDMDSFGNPLVSMCVGLSKPNSYVWDNTDCDDTNININPAVKERCNSLDDNCDGIIDEGFDLQTDVNNCGSCGVVCPAGEICENGACTLTPSGLPTVEGVKIILEELDKTQVGNVVTFNTKITAKVTLTPFQFITQLEDAATPGLVLLYKKETIDAMNAGDTKIVQTVYQPAAGITQITKKVIVYDQLPGDTLQCGKLEHTHTIT